MLSIACPDACIGTGEAFRGLLQEYNQAPQVPDRMKRRFCFAPTTSIMFGAPNNTESDTSRPKSSKASADPRQICNIRSKHFSRTGLPASTLKMSSPIMLPTCNANLCVTLHSTSVIRVSSYKGQLVKILAKIEVSSNT